jgi:transposase
MSLPSASSGLPPDTTCTPDRACHARVISPLAGRVAKVLCPQRLRLIAGGIPTEALVAHVLVARYADHLPLYRQAQILARQGIILERSTLSSWMGYAVSSDT